jgi:hypothetical protein
MTMVLYATSLPGRHTHQLTMVCAATGRHLVPFRDLVLNIAVKIKEGGSVETDGLFNALATRRYSGRDAAEAKVRGADLVDCIQVSFIQALVYETASDGLVFFG